MIDDKNVIGAIQRYGLDLEDQMAMADEAGEDAAVAHTAKKILENEATLAAWRNRMREIADIEARQRAREKIEKEIRAR